MRSRRLPGIAFEVQSPPPADVLPRMDIAAFVGFAAAGPLQRPVRVDSVAQFEMIFGSDAPLAWDAVQGQIVYAYLAPAVRAFFRNGGRRAWIIRVAGAAQTSFFPVCGLLQVSFDATGAPPELRPAFAQARSAGSWAEDHVVATAQLSDGLALALQSLDPLQFLATLTSPNDLAPGDLLRVTFEHDDVLFCSVNTLRPAQLSLPARNTYDLCADKAVWFRLARAQAPGTVDGQAMTFTHTGAGAAGAACAASVPLISESPFQPQWPARDSDEPIALDLALPYSQAPRLGSLLRVELGGETLWMLVEKVSSAGAATTADRVRVEGHAHWQTAGPAGNSAALGELVQAERLSFELWARAGAGSPLRLSGLTFDPRHPLCWQALPTDEQLYPDSDQRPRTDHPDLWAQAANPRFPLAGYCLPCADDPQPATVFVPIAIPTAPAFYLGPDEADADPLTRDGLTDFAASLFLDPDLADTGVRDLINEADTLRYYAPETRSLAGIHAALGIEEATLIVAPDVVQRGWLRGTVTTPDDPPASAPPVRPEWWHFLDCDAPQVIQPVHEPLWGNFLNCDIRVIEPPVLSVLARQQSTFTLEWTQPESGLAYRLQEATRPDFGDAALIYSGSEDQFTQYGHTSGVFYYRVQAIAGGNASDWSNGLVVSSIPLQQWRLIPADQYSDEVLLQVQHAMVRLCAARGDLLAILGLPAHYRADDAQQYVHTLTTSGSGLGGPEDARTLSFGTIYHPWLIGREESQPEELRQTPPDGAMAGIFARRTLARGAWIAPANEFLTGVVALAPAIQPQRWLDLQTSQLNLIRRLPQGFTAMNSDTLTPDEDLRPINVRRLLMLLRRLVLREGATYVFEPNDAAFRRSVQRGFEGLLDLMFQRGAFAGAVPATAYQVVTDDSLNPAVSVQQGRFIVELRVAPSLPMTFLTIRLVQTGERALVTQEA